MISEWSQETNYFVFCDLIADIIHRRSHISQTSRQRHKVLADHRRYMRTIGFRIVVLHKTMIWHEIWNKWKKIILQYFCVENSIHYSFKDAYICSTIRTYSSPYVDAIRVLWFRHQLGWLVNFSKTRRVDCSIFWIYIRSANHFATRAQVVNGFCCSVAEHWSSNPEDAGSIPSRKALELRFSQLVPVWIL